MAFFKSAKKYVKRQFKRAKGFAKSRYMGPNNYKNFQNVVKDVALLKSVINSEKKDIESLYSVQLAQNNIDASGHYYTGCTPYPVQGTGSSERTGSSIKCHSTIFNITGQAMANAVNRIKIKYYIVHVLGSPITATDPTLQFLDDSGWLATTGMRDFSSPRHQDFYSNFKVIRQGVFECPPTIDGNPRMFSKKILIKYNRGKGHHVRWIKDTTDLASGQLYLIMVADTGNENGASSTTLTGNYNQGPLTGVDMLVKIRSFYYDN